MTWRVVIGTALGLLCFAQFSLAETSGLRRLTDRDDLLGWEAVGRLDFSGEGYCTATLIETDLVLTAAHCVYGRDGTLIPADKIVFRAGLSDGVALAERQALQVEAHAKFHPNGERNWDRVRHDVALVRLREPISTTIADPFALYQGDPRGRDISMTSYGRGRSKALSRERHCNILDEWSGIYKIDCNVKPGSSGSPIFAQVGPRGRILSIVSGSANRNGRRVAYGMALPERVKELKAQLRRNRVTIPARPSSAVRRNGGARSSAKFVRPSN